MKPPKHRLSFNKMSDSDFEEFTLDLLEELGFVNLDWRKGTLPPFRVFKRYFKSHGTPTLLSRRQSSRTN